MRSPRTHSSTISLSRSRPTHQTGLHRACRSTWRTLPPRFSTIHVVIAAFVSSALSIRSPNCSPSCLLGPHGLPCDSFERLRADPDESLVQGSGAAYQKLLTLGPAVEILHERNIAVRGCGGDELFQ